MLDARDALVDSAEDRGTRGIQHFDAHTIAEFQEGRRGLALAELFEHAFFGQAR